MDPNHRSNIETYIDKLREELIEEVFGTKVESLFDNAGSTVGLGTYDASPLQEKLSCVQDGLDYVK